VNRSVYIHEIMIMLRKERKLDRLKMNTRGATKKGPICAVPMHAQQTSSLWRGVGEVSSAIEVGCGRRVQPRQFVTACQGVFGSFWEHGLVTSFFFFGNSSTVINRTWARHRFNYEAARPDYIKSVDSDDPAGKGLRPVKRKCQHRC